MSPSAARHRSGGVWLDFRLLQQPTDQRVVFMWLEGWLQISVGHHPKKWQQV
jgi:hypothetical protein